MVAMQLSIMGDAETTKRGQMVESKNTETISALIGHLKEVEARRAAMFEKGTWGRDEMEQVNQQILSVQTLIIEQKLRRQKTLSWSCPNCGNGCAGECQSSSSLKINW